MDDKFANVMPSRITQNDEPVMPKNTHKTSDASNAPDVSVPQQNHPSVVDEQNVGTMPVDEHPVTQDPAMDTPHGSHATAAERPDNASFFNTDSPNVDVPNRDHYSYGEPTSDVTDGAVILNDGTGYDVRGNVLFKLIDVPFDGELKAA